MSRSLAKPTGPTRGPSLRVQHPIHRRAGQTLCCATALACLAIAGCTRHAESPASSTPEPPSAAVATQHGFTPERREPQARPTPAPAPEPPSCGPLNCRLFATVAQALQTVLQSNPKVVAVGEAHAQRGTKHIASTAHRFTEAFLPLLAGRAKALVMELPIADGHCGESEQATAAIAKQVTRQQADSNPNEYVSLATRARALGIVPYPLRFSCEQYRRIAQAGPSDIAAALTVIAQTMEQQVVERLGDHPDGLVLTYGGALHNDLRPDATHAVWSFGPGLSKTTDDATVELDLIVREYIKDDDVWRALPWTAVFDPREHADSLVLFEPSPKSFVLIFPALEQGAYPMRGPSDAMRPDDAGGAADRRPPLHRAK